MAQIRAYCGSRAGRDFAPLAYLTVPKGHRPFAVSPWMRSARKRLKAGVWVLGVADHKTKEIGPAMITLDDSWMDRLHRSGSATARPTRINGKGHHAGNTTIQSDEAAENLIRHLQNIYKLDIPTATKYRKAGCKGLKRPRRGHVREINVPHCQLSQKVL